MPFHRSLLLFQFFITFLKIEKKTLKICLQFHRQIAFIPHCSCIAYEVAPLPLFCSSIWFVAFLFRLQAHRAAFWIFLTKYLRPMIQPQLYPLLFQINSLNLRCPCPFFLNFVFQTEISTISGLSSCSLLSNSATELENTFFFTAR